MAGIEVIIGANTDGLDDAVRGSRTRLAGLGKEMKGNILTAAKFGAAFAAAGAALTIGLTVKGLAAVDSQAKLARQLGATIDGLRATQIAASDAGIGITIMNDAAEKLNQRIGEAARGTGTAADSFKRLGLDAAALGDMDVDARMAAIADRMQELGLSTSSAADELRQMGIRNSELVNLMLQGGDAIRGARIELQELGLSLSDIDAGKVEDANDAFSRIGLTVEFASQQLAVSLAPAITAVSEQMIKEFKRGSDSLGDGIENAVDVGIAAFADFLDGAATVMDFISGNPITSQFGVLGFVIFGPRGALIGAAIGATFDIIKEGLADFGIGISDGENNARRLLSVQKQIAEQQEVIANTTSGPGNGIFIASSIADDRLNILLAAEAELKESVEGSSEALEFYNSLLNAGTMNADGLAGATRRVAAAMRETLEESEKGINTGGGDSSTSTGRGTNTPGKPSDIEDGQSLIDRLNARLELIKEFDALEVEALGVKLELQQEKIAEALEKEFISEAEARAAKLEAVAEHEAAITEIENREKNKRLDLEEKAQIAMDSLRQGAVSNAVGLLNVLGRENKAAAVAAILLTKGLAIAQTIAHTQAAGMLAFSSQLIPGVPATLATATAAKAKVHAMGAVSVGLIAATGLAQIGNATGGGGGGGGGGSMGGGGGGGNQQAAMPAPTETMVANLTITGQNFDRRTVIGLVEQINELQEDGMRIRLNTV
jgi:hypothetical protein